MTIKADAISGVVKGIFGSLDGLFTSDEERQNAETALIAELQKPQLMQALTNVEEAKHGHWFVAGWRPALGWVCAVGLLYGLVLRDLASFVASFFGVDMSGAPELDMAQIITLTLNLLGLGTLRTVEKLKGVDTREVTS